MAYRVTAGAVTVEMGIPGGRARRDVLRGEFLPDDAPLDEVLVLLMRGDVELIPDVYVSTESVTPSEPPAKSRRRSAS